MRGYSNYPIKITDLFPPDQCTHLETHKAFGVGSQSECFEVSRKWPIITLSPDFEAYRKANSVEGDANPVPGSNDGFRGICLCHGDAHIQNIFILPGSRVLELASASASVSASTCVLLSPRLSPKKLSIWLDGSLKTVDAATSISSSPFERAGAGT